MAGNLLEAYAQGGTGKLFASGSGSALNTTLPLLLDGDKPRFIAVTSDSGAWVKVGASGAADPAAAGDGFYIQPETGIVVINCAGSTDIGAWGLGSAANVTVVPLANQ